MAGNLGIARGIKSNESKTRTKLRTWRVAGVPTAWGHDHECLIPELEVAGLSNIQLTSRKSYGKKASLFFTAVSAPEVDYLELHFDGVHIVANAFYPAKGQRSEKICLKTSGALSFSPESSQPAGTESTKANKTPERTFYTLLPL